MQVRRPLLSFAATFTALVAPGFAPQARAQAVDLRFSPTSSTVAVGDQVEIHLVAFSDGVQPVQFSAIDALLAWDPQFLLLLGVDDALASGSWLASSFLLDPDGINADLSDGDGLYTALVQPGAPGLAQPGGSIITTLRFVALAETPATPLAFTPSLGLFGRTAVYPYAAPGVEVTGDIADVATVRIVGPPTAFCFGEPAACPCGNAGGLGEGCANSTGSGALLQASGSVSVADDDLLLSATQVPPFQFGLFIVGGGQINLPFGDGLRCVSAGATGLQRFNPAVNAGPSGTLLLGPGIVAHSHANFPLPGRIQVGGTYYFQAWFRDPFAGPCGSGFNLTNGLAATFTL